VRDPESPDEFAAVDLQSRNGTFLNRQRVYAPARLAHNDIIQLGPAGPEFRFELDPPPGAFLPRPRQTAGSLMLLPKEDGAPRPIGRATVERMLGDTFTKVKHESDKAVWVGAAALTAILVVGGITFLMFRQNAVDANQQNQQNQALIQQMNTDVKKGPEMAGAVRQEVERLNEQLQAAEQRNQENMQKLSKQMAEQSAIVREQEAITKQAVRDLANRPATEPAPPASEIPSSTPNPPAGSTSGKLDYDAGVRQGVELLRNGDTDGAMKLAQQLMQSQPNRWQAYSIAGSVAKLQNKPTLARSMFEKALSFAPDEVKADLQQALQDVGKDGQ
jgi:hypothetical protein